MLWDSFGDGYDKGNLSCDSLHVNSQYPGSWRVHREWLQQPMEVGQRLRSHQLTISALLIDELGMELGTFHSQGSFFYCSKDRET